jgi:2-polyprenyl-3-methyl-5-hydroxy-6-metoxy-1,4-benzoquinol methylase
MTSPVVDPSTSAQFDAEVRAGERFQFGENWRAFLKTVDDERVAEAVRSLKTLLGVETLEHRTFLDIGSGSGLFSLAAHLLGARVTSFDYDPSSVGCTIEMRRRFADGTDRWTVMHGSALDTAFLGSLGQFDVVYSWGVLHHTGQMWTAIRNVMPLTRPDGIFCIAIYNDQGAWSRRWDRIKRIYRSGIPGKALMASIVIPGWILRSIVSDLIRFRLPWYSFVEYKRNRGMSPWHDWLDWLGGWPCEVARPEDIILPLQREGFRLQNLKTQYGSMGAVEYVFRRER